MNVEIEIEEEIEAEIEVGRTDVDPIVVGDQEVEADIVQEVVTEGHQAVQNDLKVRMIRKQRNQKTTKVNQKMEIKR